MVLPIVSQMSDGRYSATQLYSGLSVECMDYVLYAPFYLLMNDYPVFTFSICSAGVEDSNLCLLLLFICIGYIFIYFQSLP